MFSRQKQQCELDVSVFLRSRCRSILNKDSVANITNAIAAKLSIVASDIHLPLQQLNVVSRTHAAGVTIQWTVFPYTLILMAALIMVLGVAGIIYICVSWSR